MFVKAVGVRESFEVVPYTEMLFSQLMVRRAGLSSSFPPVGFSVYLSDSAICISQILQSVFLWFCNLYFSDSAICISLILQSVSLRFCHLYFSDSGEIMDASMTRVVLFPQRGMTLRGCELYDWWSCCSSSDIVNIILKSSCIHLMWRKVSKVQPVWFANITFDIS